MKIEMTSENEDTRGYKTEGGIKSHYHLNFNSNTNGYEHHVFSNGKIEIKIKIRTTM